MGQQEKNWTQAKWKFKWENIPETRSFDAGFFDPIQREKRKRLVHLSGFSNPACIDD